jgi:hypothetical protein
VSVNFEYYPGRFRVALNCHCDTPQSCRCDTIKETTVSNISAASTKRQLPEPIMAAFRDMKLPVPPVGAKLVAADVDVCLKNVSISRRLEIKEMLARLGMM